MKKLSLILICLLAGAFLLGCEPKQPSPPDLPIVTPSPDDPNLMICDSAVPKPDRIVVFDAGSERTIEPDSEEFENIWLAVHQIANGYESWGAEGFISPAELEQKRQLDQVFEFQYDHIYKASEDSLALYEGIFFEIGELLDFIYLAVDEQGNPLEDPDGNVRYSRWYGVYAPDLTEDLKTLLFG